MPPSDADDAKLSIRFKFGIHTIFLFVDALDTFSALTEELLGALRERYPDGLTRSSSAPDKKTPIPDLNTNVLYGVLRVPTDPSRGWKVLNIGEDAFGKVTEAGLKDNSIVAFMFDDVNPHAKDVAFPVEWPQEDEELYDERA
ncbi:hypothetical protein ACHAPX_001055 [Trichoderma viride]